MADPFAFIDHLAQAGALTSPLQVQEAAAQANNAFNISKDTNTPQNSSWGKPIPELMGNTRTVTYPMWASPPRCVFFSRYYQVDMIDFAVMLGHIAPLRRGIFLVRIWFDGQLVHDSYSGFGGSNKGMGAGVAKLPDGLACPFMFYDGTQEDSDPTIRRWEGDPPAFTGRAYFVFSNVPTRKTIKAVVRSGLPDMAYGYSQPQIAQTFTVYTKIPEVQVEMFLPELGSMIGDDQRFVLRDMFLNYSVLADYRVDEIECDHMDVGDDARGNLIVGSQLNQTTEYKDLLSQLCVVYRIDMVETETGGIRFKRDVGDRTPLFTISAGDLVPLNGDDDSTTVQLDRVATNEIPTELQLSYLNSDQGCIPANVTVRRTKYPIKTTEAKASLTLSIPVNMQLGQATSYAGEALFDMWAGKTTFTIKLPSSFIGIEPGDVLAVQRPSGRVNLVKITQVDLSPVDYTLSVTLSSISALLPSPYYQGAIAPSQVAPLPSEVPSSHGTMITGSPLGKYMTVLDNINLGGTAHGTNKYPVYIAASTPTDIYESSTPNGTPTKLLTTGAVQPFGHVKTPAPFTMYPFQTNKKQSLKVTTVNGYVPTSCSGDDFYNGVNCIAVGAPGRWELIYYRDVTDNGDGTYTLSCLLRGRHNSEDMCGTGLADDLCVFNALSVTPATLDSDGSDVFIYGTDVGVAPSKHSGVTDRLPVTLSGYSQLAPLYIVARKQTDNSILLTWHRRERVDPADFWNDPPLTSGSEIYSLGIQQGFADSSGVPAMTYHPVFFPNYTYPYLTQVIDGNNGVPRLNVTLQQNISDPAGSVSVSKIVYVQQSPA